MQGSNWGGLKIMTKSILSVKPSALTIPRFKVLCIMKTLSCKLNINILYIWSQQYALRHWIDVYFVILYILYKSLLWCELIRVLMFDSQITGKAFVSLKFCTPCVRCPPAVVFLSAGLSAVVTEAVAGGSSVSSALCLPLPATRNSAHMAMAMPLTEQVQKITLMTTSFSKTDSEAVTQRLNPIGWCVTGLTSGVFKDLKTLNI